MSKDVLILERSSKNLKQVGNDSSKTVLEGVFAEFGVENRNGRIYEEKEYLPHMEYLKKDIASGNLLGELDHPERFEVALGNVSHRITELGYDQASRQVKGRIEILEGTPKGKIAKELLKAGIPLSISSRAAGSVNEDKTVSIQQIYTYDLVAKPGFENAQLHSVNESEKARIQGLVNKLNESHNNFQSGLKNLSPESGIVNENISIYDVSDKFPSPKLREEALEIVNVKNKSEIKNMNENQNNDTFNQWSSFVKSEMSKINERLDSMEDAILSGANGSSTKDVKTLKGYSNSLRETMEKHMDWTAEIAKSVNKLGRYTDTLAEKSNAHYNKTQKIEETVDYNAKVLNHTQDWVGNNAKVTNAIGETVDHNATMLNRVNEWTSEIARGVNALNEWGQEKAQAINGIHDWTSSLAKGVNETATWSEEMFGRAMSKKDASKLVQYIELVSEGKKSPKLKSKINEVLSKNGITGKSVSESIKGIEVIDSVKSVGNVKVDTTTSKDNNVEFDGHAIVAKIKKSGFSKSATPKELKVLTGDEKATKVGSGSSVKGVKVLDSNKSIKVSSDSNGGGAKVKNHNLKLDVKPEGKAIKENQFDKSSSIKGRESKLDEKLAKIIETLEKEKEIVNETKQDFPFVQLLNESDQKAFSALSQSDKKKVGQAVEKNPSADSNVIVSLWNNALREGVKEEPKYLAAAPEKYRKLYEAADERTKGAIEAMAEYRVLETQYQIDDFWQTTPLAKQRPSDLNESVVVASNATGKKSDGSEVDPFIKLVGEQMKQYNS